MSVSYVEPLPPPPCCTGPELAYALVGWDVGTWTDDLYKAEQDASKARREKLASAVKRVRTFSVMGGMGALLLGACSYSVCRVQLPCGVVSRWSAVLACRVQCWPVGTGPVECSSPVERRVTAHRMWEGPQICVGVGWGRVG